MLVSRPSAATPVITLLAALLILVGSASATDVRHAVILVMDGARYTETWGTANHANIPAIDSLAQFGAVLTQFRTKTNSGSTPFTETNPGHARLTTGSVQDIANDGTVLPSQPGIFQQYRKQTGRDSSSAWVITSKDKLVILTNSSATTWNNVWRPALNCGVSGTGSGGYREDNLTHQIALQKLTSDHPALMIVNYKGPDAMGHAANYSGYLAAIQEVDRYALDVWKAIQDDPVLRDSTLLFVLNDHGRHTTDYTSHGDACEGCTRLMCLVLGPHVRRDFSSATTRQQIDVAPTIARLMGFSMATSTGQYMSELFDTVQATVAVGPRPDHAEPMNIPGVGANRDRVRFVSRMPERATQRVCDANGRQVTDYSRALPLWRWFLSRP